VDPIKLESGVNKPHTRSVSGLYLPAEVHNDDIEYVKVDLRQPLEGRLQILNMLLFRRLIIHFRSSTNYAARRSAKIKRNETV